MNVIIVDDEPIIRLGLRQLIDWETSGFRLAGEAADGAEALDLLANRQVDLLVTDIRMPRMDGLELIRRVRAMREDVGIVVLSCLDDYAFVREAMRLGAADYILKPTMEPEQLLDILRALAARLQEERQKNERIREMDEALQATRSYRLQAQVQQVLERGTFIPELEEEWFGGDRQLYSMLLWLPPGAASPPGLAEQPDLAAAVRLQDQLHWLLIPCRRGLSAKDWVADAAAKGNRLLATLPADTEAVLFPAPPMDGLADFSARIAAHRGQFAGRFYGGTRERLYMTQGEHQPEKEPVWPIEARNGLLRAIAGRNEQAMMHNMLMMIGELGQLRADPERLMTFLLETVGLCLGYARDNGYGDLEKLEREYLSMERIAAFSLFEDVARWLRSFVRQLAAGRGGLGNLASRHPFVIKAYQYIRQHYAENIGTADIAGHVKLSRSYLSDLYSKETGETLTETITRVRIEESCRLLEESELKIYEIAEAVGFADGKSFARAFKRLVGCSPKEYMRSNK